VMGVVVGGEGLVQFGALGPFMGLSVEQTNKITMWFLRPFNCLLYTKAIHKHVLLH